MDRSYLLLILLFLSTSLFSMENNNEEELRAQMLTLQIEYSLAKYKLAEIDAAQKEKANTLKPVSTSASRRSTKKTIVGRERKRKQADKENSKPEQNVTAQQAISLEKLPIKKRTLRSLQNSISSENSSAIRLSNESEAIVPAGTTRYGFYRAAQDHLKKNPWLINGCSECKARIDKQPGTITLHFYSHIGMKVACCVPGCTEKRSNPDTMCRHWQNHGCSNDEETLTKFYREFERFCGAQPHSLYAQTEKEKLLLKENNS